MKNFIHESLFPFYYHKKMRYVASILFFTALTACSSQTQNSQDISPTSMSASQLSEEGGRIGLILPLTGSYAQIGQRMKDAALLAMKMPSQDGQSVAPQIDIFDSHAVGGAKKAAEDAIAAGDKIVVGPIRAAETEQVADILQNAAIPELAFTSDIEQARPNAVWVMGLTPEQQVHRLVDMAVSEGRQHFAALLPDNALGHAFAQSLVRVCQEKGLEVPKVIFHNHNVTSINDSMARLSHLKERQDVSSQSSSGSSSQVQSTVEAPIDNARSATTPSVTPSGTSSVTPAIASDNSDNLIEKILPPPPFDTLLLADTGLDLAHVIDALKLNQIDSLKVRIMGPTLWKAFDSKLGDLKGAWYSAADDNIRAHYVQDYQNAYHQGPSPVTDFAYDSVHLAKILLEERKLTIENLTSLDGFDGVAGHYNLLEDGHVLRSLGIYQILLGGGAQLIIPATQTALPK